MSFPFILQGSNITVVIGNQPHTVAKSHITYPKIVEAIKAGDWEKVRDLVEPKKVVLKYGNGHVSIEGETFYWKGKPMHNSLTTRMITMLQEDFPIEPLVLFMENLMENPSKRAVDELYGFLERNSLPITPDGHFLAYKRVRNDYLDLHSGTMDNSVGKIVEMERNQVDDNKEQTCSTGLHFCSQEYLPHFGAGGENRVVIVKINPRDVVSIPVDYNNAKGRACRYEVVGEVGNDPTDETEFTKPVQANANSVKVDEEVGPKLGSTQFYMGYTDGYECRPRNWIQNSYNKAYEEGWAKGHDDVHSFRAERYRYVKPSMETSWPLPRR